MIRLLIADDHAIVRDGLKQIFAQESDLEVMGEAADGREVLDCLRKVSFDLLLLDMSMPGTSGVELITLLRARQPNLNMLVLSMHNSPQVAMQALKAGANGYIPKSCETELLLSAIRKVALGHGFIAPELAEKMVFDATAPVHPARHGELSGREREIALMLTNGMGVKEIAQQLAISHKTVSTHKRRVLEKLNLSSLADLIRYTLQHDLQN
ncbi:MAG: LuxR family transcriptional regulator [Comamonadaceae bacterium]|nr:MAG: LuxR family transcriptional regulator [Comamonadaceae bacterium]